MSGAGKRLPLRVSLPEGDWVVLFCEADVPVLKDILYLLTRNGMASLTIRAGADGLFSIKGGYM